MLYRSRAQQGRAACLFACAAWILGCSQSLSEPDADVSVQSNAVGTCTPVDSADTTCDGLDDDCDGVFDEDCDFGPSNCPAGYNVIVGTFAADTLNGGSGKDCILGYGGNDTLNGFGKNDWLIGGPGNDSINGGGGDDVIRGGDGADVIDGNGGKDNIQGQDGNDSIDASGGDDTVDGGRCHDSMFGGMGMDSLLGGDGSDRITPSSKDTVNGGAGTDACNGTSCELSPSSPACTSNANCSGGQLCVVATGICVAPGSVAFTDPTCDGVDDDCDNQKDEDFVGSPTSCGVGACASTGTQVCTDGQVVDSCVPGTPAASDATCDGVDDDCDGSIDEDYVSQSTMCGVGACASTGMTSCVGGAVQDSCTPGTPAADDATCNNFDDDCNGQVDEDFVSSPTSCGVGACASTGSTSCVNGMVQDSCTPGTPAADDSVCNNLDDDCDGEVDEDFVSSPTSCGIGACASTGATTCVDGSVKDSCTPGTPAADDSVCNGVDDDCNGAVDEDFVASCVGTARTTCVSGAVVPVECDDVDFCNGEESCSAGACVPGTPVDVDDGDACTDDSCDPLTGEVSHEPVPVGTSCSDGFVCDGEETCQLSCLTMPSGTVAWWRGEGNADDSFDSLHGTPLNGVGFGAGEIGQAFVFDGTNDSVSLSAHAAALNSLGGQATLEFWMKSTLDICRTVFHLRQSGSAEQFLQIGNGCSGVLTNEIVTWTYLNGGVASQVAHTTTNRAVLLDSNWHHVAITLDGTTTQIYIDGAAVVTSIAVGTNHGDWGGFAAPTNAAIGSTLSTATPTLVFSGSLDEVTLYNRALTPAEIAAIYFADGAGKCESGGGGGLTCTEGVPEPAGTPCEAGGMCDGLGMCVP